MFSQSIASSLYGEQLVLNHSTVSAKSDQLQVPSQTMASSLRNERIVLNHERASHQCLVRAQSTL